MRKINFLLLLLLILSDVALQSCQSVDKEKVKVTVESFFEAYRDEDVSTAMSFYPNILNLKGKFRKSTSIDIDPTDILVVNDSNIIVKVKHHWINPFGADNTSKMKFYVAKRGESYEILDSKNFCMYDDVDLYDFAIKTGAINLFEDSTDVAISYGMTQAMPMLDLAKTYVRLQIANGLTVNKNWKWEKGYYNDYATGNAVVTNNSAFPVDSPKYEVVYYLSDDKTMVTSDNGYVCYDVIMPGQSRSFSWYTSYVGDAAKAKINVLFNNENWVDDIVKNLPFNGAEYDKFQRGEDWWPMN